MHRRGIYKQHALAHLLGVQESTITRWKNDKAISVDHAIAVCEALSISLDWFLCGIGRVERPTAGDEYDIDLASHPGGLGESCSPFWYDSLAMVQHTCGHADNATRSLVGELACHARHNL